MFKSLLLFLCLLVPVTAKAEVLNANQILESTCRVTAGQYFGSGSVIKHENGKFFILTNAHVVGNNNTVYLEFFKNGRKTLPFPGEVVWKQFKEKTSMDFAIVSIDEKYFGKYPPRVVKLAPASVKALDGYVMSAGCPGARWPSAFEGFIIREESDRILFYPPPLGGQSGSGLYIFAKDSAGQWETYLKGVVTWRIGGGVPGKTTQMGYEMNHGGAASVDVLVSAYGGQVAEPASIPDNYETVLFDRLKSIRVSPSKYNYNIRPVKPAIQPVQPVKPVQPKVEPKVVDAPIVTVPEPVLDKSRLLPIIRPDETPTPDTTPNPNGPVVPSDNPYDVMPDVPVNPTPPPVVQEQQEKESGINIQLPEDWKTWLGGSGFGLVLMFIGRYMWKNGYFTRLGVAYEAFADAKGKQFVEKVGPKIGAENAEFIREKVDNLDDIVQERVKQELARRLGVTTTVVNTMEPVSFVNESVPVVSNVLTLRQAQNTVLNPVAQAVFTEEATRAIGDFVNRLVIRALKNEEGQE